MPVKSGTSHAMAAFLLMIASAFIIKYLEHHQTFELLLTRLNFYAVELSSVLEEYFEISMQKEILVMVLIASSLSFIWGFIYQMSRRQ